MLKKVDDSTVQGDGFRVVVPNIHCVIYSEDHRETQVEIEGGMSEDLVDWLIYAETLGDWRIERGIEPMTDSDREIVLSRISGSLLVLNMPHRLA